MGCGVTAPLEMAGCELIGDCEAAWLSVRFECIEGQRYLVQYSSTMLHKDLSRRYNKDARDGQDLATLLASWGDGKDLDGDERSLALTWQSSLEHGAFAAEFELVISIIQGSTNQQMNEVDPVDQAIAAEISRDSARKNGMIQEIDPIRKLERMRVDVKEPKTAVAIVSIDPHPEKPTGNVKAPPRKAHRRIDHPRSDWR